ncbi:MAG: amidohydrolase [Candidatus Zixiibacteriota bacterium]|nr:MAG: amidohydrolase [candidate division Zixibacteria bacterium]
MKNLMLLNGNVYTMDPRLPMAEAVAIEGSKIIAVGKTSDVENLGRKNFRVIDLKGKPVIPGLTDCHTHFLSFAHGLRRVNLHGVSSFGEILSTIEAFAAKLKDDEWLVGGGWDKNIVGGESLFSRQALDKLCPGHPVALQSKDHHVLWVNSKALELAGIDKTTNDPRGGMIEKDRNTGEPTGILKEKACNLVWEKIPPPPADASKKSLRQAMRIANSSGLTGIQNHDDPRAHELFAQLESDGVLTLRVSSWLPKEELDSAMDSGMMSGQGSDNLKLGGAKFYCDGSLGSQTALMFEPFEGSKDNYGIEATSEEELTEMVAKASRAGIGTAIHAIGDRAVHQSLNSIEKSVQQRREGGRLRHRIEHVQLLHPDDAERFRKLGVVASVQPVHTPADIDIAEKYWGKRSKYAYAFKTLLDSGARVVFGSDAPIETIDPWMGIHAAVTRHRIEEKESWYPEEKVSLADAISAFTRWASYASYEENLKGSIEVGKLADMIVLSQDVFKTDPEDIPDTKVECTILGGRIVHQS